MGQAAEQNDCERERDGEQLAEERRAERGEVWRWDDEGALEDLEVVVERDGAHGDGEHDEPEQRGGAGGALKGGDEEVELAEEAGERRDSGEREDKDGEACGERRRAAAEAGECG